MSECSTRRGIPKGRRICRYEPTEVLVLAWLQLPQHDLDEVRYAPPAAACDAVIPVRAMATYYRKCLRDAKG